MKETHDTVLPCSSLLVYMMEDCFDVPYDQEAMVWIAQTTLHGAAHPFWLPQQTAFGIQ